VVSREYLVVLVVTIISIICHAEADLDWNRKFKKRHAMHHNILSGVVDSYHAALECFNSFFIMYHILGLYQIN
jgi:hypothetical protein